MPQNGIIFVKTKTWDAFVTRDYVIFTQTKNVLKDFSLIENV